MATKISLTHFFCLPVFVICAVIFLYSITVLFVNVGFASWGEIATLAERAGANDHYVRAAISFIGILLSGGPLYLKRLQNRVNSLYQDGAPK